MQGKIYGTIFIKQIEVLKKMTRKMLKICHKFLVNEIRTLLQLHDNQSIAISGK